MDYGFDTDNFKNYSRVVNYYNDLEEFLISIKPMLSFFEYELDQIYTQYFHLTLNIQEDKFRLLNKDKNLSLFNYIFPQFYTKDNNQSLKSVLKTHYKGVEQFLSYDEFVNLLNVDSLSELAQKNIDIDITDLFKNPLFFSIKNKNQEQKKTFLTESLAKSKLSGVLYHETFDSVGHFDQFLKNNFIFINKFEFKLDSNKFDSSLLLFKELVEIGFQQYFKTSSFPRFKSLSDDYSRRELLEVLNENKDLSIYHLPDNFKFNQYYLLSNIYQHANEELVNKVLEKYPLTQEMLDYLYQNKQLENTAFSKFLLKYKLEEKLPENKGKSFNKI